jgi:hypothetical protein
VKALLIAEGNKTIQMRISRKNSSALEVSLGILTQKSKRLAIVGVNN